MRRLVDDEALDLMELWRMRRIRIDAVGAARADHADRRFLRQHGAHLHRARVRAQQLALAVGARVEEERVVHLAGRMALGKVQLGEIVVVGLDVRTLGDRKAHVGEDFGQLVHHLGDGMDAAGVRPA